MNWTDALAGLMGPEASKLFNAIKNSRTSQLAKQGLQRQYPRYSSPAGPFLPKPAPSLEARMPRNIYGDQIPDEYGPPRRSRGRGITARDLRSFRRVANLIRKYAAPVRHFRTHPKRGH